MVHVLDLWPDTVLASGFARPGRAYRVGPSSLIAPLVSRYVRRGPFRGFHLAGRRPSADEARRRGAEAAPRPHVGG